MYKSLIFCFLFLTNLGFCSAEHKLQNISRANHDSTNNALKYNTQAYKFFNISADSTIKYANMTLIITRKLNIDTITVSALELLGKTYVKKRSYNKAIKYLLDVSHIYYNNNWYNKYFSTMLDLSRIYFNMSYYDSAMVCYETILKYETKNDENNWSALAHHGIGSIYYSMGKYELALYHLKNALEEVNLVMNDRIEASILYMIGATYTALSQYDKAIDYLLNSLVKSQEINDSENESLTYLAIAIIYERLKNFEMSILYNNHALTFSNKFREPSVTADILDHLAILNMHTSKYDSALNHANRSLIIHKSIKNKLGIANTLDIIGDIYFNKSEYFKALIYYNDAWDTIEKIDEKYRKSKILTHLGVVYTKLNKFPLAHEKLKQGMELARITKAQDLVKEGLLAFSEYYASTKDFDHAYKNLLTYSQLRDSIFTVSSHHIAEMQMRYETGKREKENKLLRNQIEIHKLEIDKNKIKSWLSYLSLIVVSMIGFFSYNRYRSKKKANIVLEDRIRKALQKQEEQQHIIFHQASLSSLGELAAGMAHEINQPLQNIKLATESIELDSRNFLEKHPAIRESIQEIYHAVERIRHLINHVRLFSSQQANHIHELFRVNPVIDNALMLVRKQYLKKGIQIKTILDKKPYKIEGNPFKFEQVVINILSNAKDALIEKEKKLERYFQKEISIETIKNDNQVIMRITDNGSGINMDNEVDIFHPFYTTKKLGKGSGLGLSIVQGIVTEMKGTISFTSGQSTGTTIEIKLPISVRRKSTTRRNKK